MNKTTWIVIVIVVVVVVGGLIWWYSSMGPSYMASSTPPQATTTPTSAAQPTLVLGSSSQFPSYIAAANGMALYTYSKDTAGVSNCTGSCAAIWPPYTVSSASGLTAGSNITGMLGTITRSDGTLQVTYNGMPLYFFAQDTSAGNVTGNGQNGFSVAMAMASQATTPAPTTPAPAPYTPPSSGYNY